MNPASTKFQSSATEGLQTELCTVRQLFDDPASPVYRVPIYQRSYAWGAQEIEQLITDVSTAELGPEDRYFLGNLVVTNRGGARPDYEVVDGQQRLTTLYLILAVLKSDCELPGDTFTAHVEKLLYSSRPHASEILREADRGQFALTHIDHEQEPPSEMPGARMREALSLIVQAMQQLGDASNRDSFRTRLLDRVQLVRAELPKQTDLNRYFEVMNTRGQQLNQVDIVKARVMSNLPGRLERQAFARVWEACANMDQYAQINLTRGDTGLRHKLFKQPRMLLNVTGFDEICEALFNDLEGENASPSADIAEQDGRSLQQAIRHELMAQTPDQKQDESQTSERFRSTIEFPILLLHVLKLLDAHPDDSPSLLDDRKLIERFNTYLARTDNDMTNPAARARLFAFTLLQVRVLFDTFIIKREHSPQTSEEGDWSLRRLAPSRSSTKGRAQFYYPSTFAPDSQTNFDGEADDSPAGDLLLIQSMLRVTFTSPRTMHWITLLLRELWLRDADTVSEVELVELLRGYTRKRVREIYPAGAEPEGFHIPRLVFTYLDYLLLMHDRASGQRPRFRNFTFSFRTSIEHFFPQSPDREQAGAVVSAQLLNSIGNLALVSVSANSKFSNSLPLAKAHNFTDTIVQQSPKLDLMARTTRKRERWGDVEVREHAEAMQSLLHQDLGQAHT